MKRSKIFKFITMMFAIMLMTASLSGCKMNLPDTSGIGPDAPADQSAADAEDGEKSDKESADGGEDFSEMDFDGDEENEDVTAGTVDDGAYTSSAYVKDAYFNVDAVEAVLKDKDAANAKDAQDKSGDLDKARLAYLTNYYEGDAASAKEDLAEYEKASPSADQMKAIQGFYPEIGKVFAQFDITNYDLTSPTEADDSYVTYDVFSTDNEPFTLEISFDEGVVSEINLSYDGDLG